MDLHHRAARIEIGQAIAQAVGRRGALHQPEVERNLDDHPAVRGDHRGGKNRRVREPRVLLNVRADNLRDVDEKKPVAVSIATALSYDGDDARLQHLNASGCPVQARLSPEGP